MYWFQFWKDKYVHRIGFNTIGAAMDNSRKKMDDYCVGLIRHSEEFPKFLKKEPGGTFENHELGTTTKINF